MPPTQPGRHGGTINRGNYGNRGGGRPPKITNVVPPDELKKLVDELLQIARGRSRTRDPQLNQRLQAYKMLKDIALHTAETELTPEPTPKRQEIEEPKENPAIKYAGVVFQLLWFERDNIDHSVRLRVMDQFCARFGAPIPDSFLNPKSVDPVPLIRKEQRRILGDDFDESEYPATSNDAIRQEPYYEGRDFSEDIYE